MTKQDIIDYIMETPGNTNPAILNQMIDEVGGGGNDIKTANVKLNGNSEITIGLHCLTLDGYIDDKLCSFDGTTYKIPMYILDNPEHSEWPYGQGGLLSYRGENQLNISIIGSADSVEQRDDETGEYNYVIIISGDCTITIS